MNKATITFNTELDQDDLTTKLEQAGVLSTLADQFMAYPVVTVLALTQGGA